MESQTNRQFRDLFAGLPTEIKQNVRKAYALFRENSNHPSLQFKKVHASEPIFSVRVTLDYRAVGLRHNDLMIWFWIGNHADYEKLLKKL